MGGAGAGCSQCVFIDNAAGGGSPVAWGSLAGPVGCHGASWCARGGSQTTASSLSTPAVRLRRRGSRLVGEKAASGAAVQAVERPGAWRAFSQQALARTASQRRRRQPTPREPSLSRSQARVAAPLPWMETIRRYWTAAHSRAAKQG